MLTFLAWFVFIVSVPWNLIIIWIMIDLKLRGPGFLGHESERFENIVTIFLSLFALFTSGVYLFGLW